MAHAFIQILGIRFYRGNLDGLFPLLASGGLIVFPSAPVLADADPHHRAALEGSEFAVIDSGYLVLLWALLRRERLERLSGLRFMEALVARPEFARPGASFWVMPSAEDARCNVAWLASKGVNVPESAYRIAPQYAPGPLSDVELLRAIDAFQPQFVVIALGGGVQERLGHYLARNLACRPAILCTGAAIAFLTGRQANIPGWADRLFLGWLMRILREPRKFIPRYLRSVRVAGMVARYGSNRPD